MPQDILAFIPSTLAPLLQIDLLVLQRLCKKNAAQHRSGLFFRRVHEISRLGKGIYTELAWLSKYSGGDKEKPVTPDNDQMQQTRGRGKGQNRHDRQWHVSRLDQLLNKVRLLSGSS